ncbi:MAG: dephospho-CoA kinase, partial [Burkholderiales bacterium]|nr:dephospho-CoA kinase [Burkholderiales bacterium]
LLEHDGYRDRVDRVLVVDCLPETQIVRVTRRNGLPREQIERILAAQIDRAARLAAADDIIDNDGPPERLPPQVEQLHRRYLAAAGLLDRAL